MSELFRRLRHGLVRLIAPKLYIDYEEFLKYKDCFFSHAGDYPRQGISYIKPYVSRPKLLEIGNGEGLNALSMIQELNPVWTVLVDPYIRYTQFSYKYEYLGSDWDENMNKMLKNLEPIKNKTFIRKTSDDFFKENHEVFDVIYIDGNHEYNYAKRDLDTSFRCLSNGGFVLGHDMHFSGTYQAVKDWCLENKISFLIKGFDFVIRKNQTNPD